MENNKKHNDFDRENPKTGEITEGKRQHFNHESDALSDSEQFGKTEELMPNDLNDENQNASYYRKAQQKKDKSQNDGMEQQDDK
ncbi:MAG: hypothetical protein EOO42_09195 [Flavobacteriales bacterium]|nr:MAG: hypothetical protein EOO42_09195 [Flavobacteriales bacterium]